MSGNRKPLFLPADSQPLFLGGSGALLSVLQECLQVSRRNLTRAAHIGVSNGYAPEFFALFVGAVGHINLHRHRSSSMRSTDRLSQRASSGRLTLKIEVE